MRPEPVAVESEGLGRSKNSYKNKSPNPSATVTDASKLSIWNL